MIIAENSCSSLTYSVMKCSHGLAEIAFSSFVCESYEGKYMNLASTKIFALLFLIESDYFLLQHETICFKIF